MYYVNACVKALNGKHHLSIYLSWARRCRGRNEICREVAGTDATARSLAGERLLYVHIRFTCRRPICFAAPAAGSPHRGSVISTITSRDHATDAGQKNT